MYVPWSFQNKLIILLMFEWVITYYLLQQLYPHCQNIKSINTISLEELLNPIQSVALLTEPWVNEWYLLMNNTQPGILAVFMYQTCLRANVDIQNIAITCVRTLGRIKWRKI